MLKDQKDLLAVFNSHGVRYLVVRAHAVGVHAEPRGTKNLDVFIHPSPTNSEAVFAALAEFGAPLTGMTPADFNDAPGRVFQMGVPLAKSISSKRLKPPTSTKRGYRIETSIAAGIPIQVISRDDLIRNKLAVGPPQNLLDVGKIREAAQVNRTVKPDR